MERDSVVCLSLKASFSPKHIGLGEACHSQDQSYTYKTNQSFDDDLLILISIVVKKGYTYFSMNCFCCCSSIRAKNSFISAAVGICLRIEFSPLLDSVVTVGLVLDPGVLMPSGSLIKLQGVLSLVVLQSCTLSKCKDYKEKRRGISEKD